MSHFCCIYCKPAYCVLFSGWCIGHGSSLLIQSPTFTQSLTIFMGNQFKPWQFEMQLIKYDCCWVIICQSLRFNKEPLSPSPINAAVNINHLVECMLNHKTGHKGGGFQTLHVVLSLADHCWIGYVSVVRTSDSRLINRLISQSLYSPISWRQSCI